MPHESAPRRTPLETYDYVVNGKSALDSGGERLGIKTDNDTGIVNDWAAGAMCNPGYPLELFQLGVTVSVAT